MEKRRERVKPFCTLSVMLTRRTMSARSGCMLRPERLNRLRRTVKLSTSLPTLAHSLSAAPHPSTYSRWTSLTLSSHSSKPGWKARLLVHLSQARATSFSAMAADGPNLSRLQDFVGQERTEQLARQILWLTGVSTSLSWVRRLIQRLGAEHLAMGCLGGGLCGRGCAPVAAYDLHLADCWSGRMCDRKSISAPPWLIHLARECPWPGGSGACLPLPSLSSHR